MQAFVDGLNAVLASINDVIWHEYVLFGVLAVGLLFTVWSKFGQIHSLTHGTALLTGKYDNKSDPGAISHFQALSAALSATVGIGNIGGVALAVALGGPGAIFWMWVIGFIGMALKMTEVTLAMLYRNIDDPENPHGGAMWVADKGMPRINPRLRGLGKVIAGIFCVTLLISTITGGNMFQAWNVAEVTYTNFPEVSRLTCGIVLAVLTGLVIIGGIKRIGSVAGALVPFMCGIYLLAGLWVLWQKADLIPGLFAQIFHNAFNPVHAQGAFLGGTFGAAFVWGMKRALFSNEAGQGSAPIAHSAARTDEPVSEGIVAGLEPFIDTLVVCTLTALIILASGTWNRGPEAHFDIPPVVKQGKEEGKWTLETIEVPRHYDQPWHPEPWKNKETVFVIVRAGKDERTGSHLHRIEGEIRWKNPDGQTEEEKGPLVIEWNEADLDQKPELVKEEDAEGKSVVPLYNDYKGAALTSHAFDRVTPGLGRWMVTLAVWLFALSTVISWSYYGEQGMIYLFGNVSVMPYRVAYCLFIVVACAGLFTTETELDNISSLGTGVMLLANLPICLIFARETMAAYNSYIRRWKAGEFDRPRAEA
jgi:alanine or glycine:cation symporter, AGCS family